MHRFTKIAKRNKKLLILIQMNLKSLDDFLQYTWKANTNRSFERGKNYQPPFELLSDAFFKTR